MAATPASAAHCPGSVHVAPVSLSANVHASYRPFSLSVAPVAQPVSPSSRPSTPVGTLSARRCNPPFPIPRPHAPRAQKLPRPCVHTLFSRLVLLPQASLSQAGPVRDCFRQRMISTSRHTRISLHYARRLTPICRLPHMFSPRPAKILQCPIIPSIKGGARPKLEALYIVILIPAQLHPQPQRSPRAVSSLISSQRLSHLKPAAFTPNRRRPGLRLVADAHMLLPGVVGIITCSSSIANTPTPPSDFASTLVSTRVIRKYPRRVVMEYRLRPSSRVPGYPLK